MAWIELHQSLWTHRKTLILAGILDLDETYAAAHIARLWTWALDNAPEGDLSGLPSRVLAFAAGWRGDPTTFFNALVEAGWLDDDDAGTTALHDWQDYAGRLIEKRRSDADRLRRWRATQRDETSSPPTRNADETRTNAVTVPNRTSVVPDLTIPEVKPKEPGPPVVVVEAPGRRAATTAAATNQSAVPFMEFSEDARAVLEEWRQAHGKRSPPKLNPTQAAKLEAAVADLGAERLRESARWSAEKGLAEFHKCITAAYTKRQRDEAGEQAPVMGRRNGHEVRGPQRDSPFTKYG